MADSSKFTISELADAAGTTPRTVRFYTAEGLLPPPDSRGRFALYSTEHLDRLLLINRLKQAFQPLNAIRERLVGLNAADIRSILSRTEGRPPAESLNDLLVKSAEVIRARNALSHGFEQSDNEGQSFPDLTVSERSPDTDSEMWQRTFLAPGLELQIRLPLAAGMEVRVAELIDRAHELFNPEIRIR
jgi:DNA-binding transcriptional MerR regulator